MTHLGMEALRRLLRGEGDLEAEAAAEHLLACDRCRTLAGTAVDELRTGGPRLAEGGPLQLLFTLIDRERQWGVETLTAVAEWAELRRLPSRRSQRDRVRMTKACHTTEFFNLAVIALKEESSWDEAEFLAGLALLCVEAMSQRSLIGPARGHDLQAEIWTAVANARRRAAEWKRAHQALAHAERHLKEGTQEPLLEAGLLSITATTLADEGQVAKALDALEKCRAIYDALSEWHLLARTLVQVANILSGTGPSAGLVVLDHANALIPANDSDLRLRSELLRVECLVELQRPSEAVQVFRRCYRQVFAHPTIRMRIRGKFAVARLLDSLGLYREAERLFDEVVERDIEHERYKDAFLDLLYLYGRHVKIGDLEKAARVCRRALTDSSLAAIAHDQLRDVWSQLLETAKHRAISQDLLRDLRQYLNAHWKHPAATPPVVTGR